MQQADPSTTAFLYLFNEAPRLSPINRLDQSRVTIQLPSLKTAAEQDIELTLDVRDQRVLIIFDGDIPWNGFPRSGHVIRSFSTIPVTKRGDYVRKARSFEEPSPPSVRDLPELNSRELTLNRQFALLPAGTAVIRRYRSDSLAGIYSMVEVFRSGGNASVTWRNSSY